MKKMLVFAFGFGVAMLSSAAAFAACTPGNNGNGCSWSCNGNTAQVSCQNTSVGGMIPRCYNVDTTTNTTTPTRCTDSHGSNVAPNPGTVYTNNTAAQSTLTKMKYSDGDAPAPTPTPVKAEKLKGQKQGELKKD